MEIPDYFTDLSIRMSEALDDIGAGTDTVRKRRGIFIWRERMATMINHLLGRNWECFHFGSQSEGTTTPGLQSDIDYLTSNNNVNIMTDWRDWKDGMSNLLMLHDDITPPQQYLLQVIRTDTPEPVTRVYDHRHVRKGPAQVLFSSERWKQQTEDLHKTISEVSKRGPSVSGVPNWDIVYAFHVRKPLPEIQHWIDSRRPRHWPSTQLLEAARVAPCFLVPAGHPDSDYKREEWRMSPNLIERMLMFSFNMTQIKCYIVLKLIKKALFAKIVEDGITSFHCKTIMFYTIERTHPSLWEEHNLMFLILLCLQTLRKCLLFGRLPHYIISGVNLFDGKLSKGQQRRLVEYVDSMIKNDLHDVFYIDIDNLGCRLRACGIREIGRAGELGRVSLRNSISLLLEFERWRIFLIGLRIVTQLHSGINIENDITCMLGTTTLDCKNVILKPAALEYAKHMFTLRNSLKASIFIRLGNVDFSEITRRFQYSLDTDVASTRLKLASVLYCSGQLLSAAAVLDDVERRYHSKIKAVCGCRDIKGQSDLQVFGNMISGHCDNGFGEPPFALCVKFQRQEAYCAPHILLFEMNRGMTEEEVAQRNHDEKQWMDCAEVDARLFLHYLQYLTYGGLGDRDKQLHAMGVLETYICDPRNAINMYHGETALNWLGHCYEMEGDYEGALHYYEESLRYYDTNNAANWHVRRVMRLISG